MPSPTKKSKAITLDDKWVLQWVLGGFALYLTTLAAYAAYTIRLKAIAEYGPVIHEFDPYFNYRATEVCMGAGRVPLQGIF
jgi:dolichyl-diphosphooligosaccharide--protein glycosyltransferase